MMMDKFILQQLGFPHDYAKEVYATLPLCLPPTREVVMNCSCSLGVVGLSLDNANYLFVATWMEGIAHDSDTWVHLLLCGMGNQQQLNVLGQLQILVVYR